MVENVNGERTRLRMLEELGESGCSYGRVNRERIDNLKARVDGIDTKLWAILCGVVLQLFGLLIYLLTHPATVKAVMP